MKSNGILAKLIVCGVLLAGVTAYASDEISPAGKTESESTTSSKVEAKPEEILITMKVPLFADDFSPFPLAKVNDEKITLAEFNKSLSAIHEGMGEGKRAAKQDYAQILNRLINAQLITQEALNMGLDQSPEVKEALDRFSKKLMRDTLLSEHVKDVKPDEKAVEKSYKENTIEWKMKSLEFKTEDEARKFEKELKTGKDFGVLYEKALKDGVAEGSKEDTYIKRTSLHPGIVTLLTGMKIGSVSPVVPLQKGFLIFKLLDTRYAEDAKVKEQVYQDLMTQARLKAIEDYRDALIKKYVKQNTKLVDSLDFEAKKPGFESMSKDKRVIAEIKGEKPITVADLAEAIKEKFYHGVEIAIKEKKVNKSKKDLLLQMLSTRVIEKEAVAKRVDQSDEFKRKAKEYQKSLLFGTFVEKVIVPEVKITNDELQAYYKEHISQYTYPEMYKIDAIVFAASQDAEAGIDKLRKGMDFNWFKSNAEGRLEPGLHPKLDFIGNTVLKSQLPGDVQKVLTGVTSGEYRLYAGDNEYYVLNVQEVIPPQEQPFSVAEADIQQTIYKDKLTKSLEAWASKLRAASDVKIYAEFSK